MAHRNTEPLAWIDGTTIPLSEASVPLTTNALHYGSGTFEGIRIYSTDTGRAIFRLDDHLLRLKKSADALHMRLPYSISALKKAIVTLAKGSGVAHGYVRPLAFFGGEYLGFDMRHATPRVALLAIPWKKYTNLPKLSIMISPYRKPAIPTHALEAKLCGYYALSILALRDATESGFESAVLLDSKGNLAEGPTENLFIVKDGVLKTPKRGSILPGITRETLLALAYDNGLRTKEATLTPQDLFDCDEAFFSGTGSELSPIVRVNRKRIGKGDIGPLTKKILSWYSEVVSGKNAKYRRWLTPL